MLRLVTVNEPRVCLPTEAALRPEMATYLFVVLKENEGDYLLEMPPNSGGHTSSSTTPAWWVSKGRCKSAYKAGQRWQHMNKFVSELTHDNLNEVSVVQILSSCIWNKGDTIPEPTIESYVEGWTYLRGQDRPQE